MIAEFTLFATLAFHHVVIGVVLILLARLLLHFLASSAETRSWIWLTLFFIASLIPFSLLLPDAKPATDTHSDILIASELPVIEVSTETGQARRIALTEPQLDSFISEDYWHFSSEAVYRYADLLKIFMALWAVGSFRRCVALSKTFRRTRRLLSESRPVSAAELGLDADALALSTPLFISERARSPMVVGVLRPVIVLPQHIVDRLEAQQLAPVLLHEQAHIRRGDIVFGLLQELVALVFWWSPVLRYMNHTIHIERELACDLRAVKQLDSAKNYAQSLVDCAKYMINEQRNILAMGLFSHKKELQHRVSEVLKSKKVKLPTWKAVAAICVGLTATSIHATQSFSPKISVVDTSEDAIHYSQLPPLDGDKLIAAVANNDIEAILALQTDGVDINTPAVKDGTALIIAVQRNNTTMVQALIELGADVNQSSVGDGNPLIAAAMRNNLPLAELLLGYGANVNAVVPRDETALINATRAGYLEMTRLLIEHGADVNLAVRTGMSDGYEVRSPLNMASDAAVRELLLANGAIE